MPTNETIIRRVVMDAAAVAGVPDTVREEAQRRFEEIAEGLRDIPPGSPFWQSVRVSRLCLVVRGFSFYYTVHEETLRVTELRRRQ